MADSPLACSDCTFVFRFSYVQGGRTTPRKRPGFQEKDAEALRSKLFGEGEEGGSRERVTGNLLGDIEDSEEEAGKFVPFLPHRIKISLDANGSFFLFHHFEMRTGADDDCRKCRRGLLPDQRKSWRQLCAKTAVILSSSLFG